MSETKIGNVKLPDGITRKTHLIVVRKNLDVVAIERNAEMIANASKTRSKNAEINKERQAKKLAILSEKNARKAARDEVANLKEEAKEKIAAARDEVRRLREDAARKSKAIRRKKA